MFKLFFKIKKKLKEKGFTLVELLAVIVILAIIMIIAIPAVLNTMSTAKKKSFVTYADRINTLADSKFLSENMMNNAKGDGCYIYNIETDFDLNNTGDYKGYVLLSINDNKIKYYYTLWSNDYMLIAYNYTESITYNGNKKSMVEALETYNESRKDELTPASLCNYACSYCTYDNAINDTNNPDRNTPSSFNGDITKIRGAVKLLAAASFRTQIKSLTGDNSLIEYIKKSDTLDETATKVNVSVSDEIPIYMWFKDSTLYFYKGDAQIFLPDDSTYLFYGFTNVIDLNDFLTNVRADNVISITKLFSTLSKLESADLSNWNTPNLKSMSGLFNGCNSIKEIKANNLNTSKVTNLSDTFNGCKSLETVNITNWDTSKVTDFTSMFKECTSMKELDVSHFNTANAQYMTTMFSECKADYLDISNFKVENVTSINAMFNKTRSSSLDFSKWKTNSLTNLKTAFYGCSTRILDLSSFDTSKVTSFSDLFNFSKAEIIDLSSWDSSKVTNMYRMFTSCSQLEHIYIGEKWTTDALIFETGKENSNLMFHLDTKLPGYDSNYRGHTKAHAGEGGYMEYK